MSTQTAQEGKQNEQGWERQSLVVNREYSVVSGTDWICFIWKQFSPKKELLGGGRPRAATMGTEKALWQAKAGQPGGPQLPSSCQVKVRRPQTRGKQGQRCKGLGRELLGWRRVS